MINWHIYNALKDERYNLVIYLARFADKMKLCCDEHRRIAVINHAIALRELGAGDEVEGLLSKYDWFACAMRFDLVLLVLNGEEEEFFRLLPRAVAAGEVSRCDLKEWPLFREFRGTLRFQSIVDSSPVPLPESEESDSEESDGEESS